jgi:hypothetical protein
MDALQHARVVAPGIRADAPMTRRAPLDLVLLECAWLAPFAFDDDTAKAHSQHCVSTMASYYGFSNGRADSACPSLARRVPLIRPEQ